MELKLKPRKIFYFASLGLGSLGGILGKNSNILEPRQSIHQNEALGPVIKKKWFPRSSDPQIGGIWSQNSIIFKP